MALLCPLPYLLLNDANGIEPGWRLYTYDAGTTTPRATFTDANGNVANTNPVVADGLGRMNVWLDETATYRLILRDSADQVVMDVDQIQGVGSGTGTADPADVSEWLDQNDPPTYVSMTQFSVPGNRISTYHPGRRMRIQLAAQVAYGTITASTFGAGVTIVTLEMDSVDIDTGISALAVGINSADNPSISAECIVGDVGGASVTVSETPPVDPGDGDQWYRSTDGRQAIWYDDGNSQQWVESGPGVVTGGPAAMTHYLTVDLAPLSEVAIELEAGFDYEFLLDHKPVTNDSQLVLELSTSGISGPWLQNIDAAYEGQQQSSPTSNVATNSPAVGNAQSSSAADVQATQVLKVSNHDTANWRTTFYGEYYNQRGADQVVQAYRHYLISQTSVVHDAFRLYWSNVGPPYAPNGSLWQAGSTLRASRRFRG